MLKNQGYLIIATGDLKYLKLAEACAASIKFWDKSRKIQLVTDIANSSAVVHGIFFDYLTLCEPDERFEGAMVRLRMLEFSVFDETMFLDADCLMMKGDIETYWDILSKTKDVSTPGEWASVGSWYNFGVSQACELAGVSRLVRMNSGVFFFKKTDLARKFFESARRLFFRLGNFANYIHRDLGPADELYFALAFGETNIDPFPMRDAEGNAWMLSTINSVDHVLEPFTGLPSYKKGGLCSPTICHFVDLSPVEHYHFAADAYKNRLIEN